MKRFIKYTAFFAVILAFLTAAVNTETDLLSSFELYAPEFCASFPEVNNTLKSLSAAISHITDNIPSTAEIAAMIKHEELPIDPEDVAYNAFIEDSPMLTFYPKENISAVMTSDGISVFGVTSDKNKSHLIVNINTLSGEQLDQTSFACDSDGKFSKTVKIPDTDESTLEVSVYTGRKQFGEYRSWVLNYLYITRENGEWAIMTSPVYEHNLEMYKKDKSLTDALKSTPSIQSESNSVISIATELTKDLTDDYDKALALHDWVCKYLYYDKDSIAGSEALPYSAIEVIASKRAVCLGYATLYASLCRSIDIPCNVVAGYALGVGEDIVWSEANIDTTEQNHAWNEVYADGRWVIVDTTWDSANTYENGETQTGDISHLYFDANIEAFSMNHKIIEYSKKR